MQPSLSTQLTMEHTPGYFVAPWVPQRVYKYKPDIKLILILTDPVRRLHSDYLHTKHLHPDYYHAQHTFEECIFNKGSRTLNTSYVPLTKGLYSVHLQRYLKYFKREQILIVDGERFKKKPWKSLNRVEKFLNISPYFTDDCFVKDVNKGFYCLKSMGCMPDSKGRYHPPISNNTLKILQDFYRQPNLEFKKLAGVDFEWLK